MATIYRPRTTNDPSYGETSEIFSATDTYIFEEYIAGDMNGNSTYFANYLSDTPDSQTALDLSLVGDIYVSYCVFDDINVINGIIYADSTCLFAGRNNNGIVLYVPVNRRHKLKVKRFFLIGY